MSFIFGAKVDAAQREVEVLREKLARAADALERSEAGRAKLRLALVQQQKDMKAAAEEQLAAARDEAHELLKEQAAAWNAQLQAALQAAKEQGAVELEEAKQGLQADEVVEAAAEAVAEAVSQAKQDAVREMRGVRHARPRRRTARTDAPPAARAHHHHHHAHIFR